MPKYAFSRNMWLPFCFPGLFLHLLPVDHVCVPSRRHVEKLQNSHLKRQYVAAWAMSLCAISHDIFMFKVVFFEYTFS